MKAMFPDEFAHTTEAAVIAVRGGEFTVKIAPELVTLFVGGVQLLVTKQVKTAPLSPVETLDKVRVAVVEPAMPLPSERPTPFLRHW